MCNEHLLKQHVGSQKVVFIRCRDGRLIAAHVLHVDDEYQDVIIRGVLAESRDCGEYSPIGVVPLSEILAIEAPPTGLSRRP